MRMRPRISWSDLRGQRVGVWGLGVEGRAAVSKLATLGIDEPVLVDDAAGAEAPAGLPILTTAGAGLDALSHCDVVVKSPGISRHRPDVAELTRGGTAVVGGLGLWLEDVDRSRVALVTGTKGKSTTVSVAGHLAQGLGTPCFVGGNLGLPPYAPGVDADVGCWIIELSSFQATDLACSPPVVAVTSLHADHLDWHGDFDTYVADKLSACNQPGAELTIANGDDVLLRSHFADLGPRVEWVELGPGPEPGWIGELGLRGAHNRRNALTAQACLVALGVPGADDDSALARAAGGFGPLDSRLRVIARAGDVEFVDDSLSTNVLPTVAALDAFPDRRVAVIVGGHDRGIDYSCLAPALAARGCPTLVVTIPDNGERIAEELAQAGLPPKVEIEGAASLEEAVAPAYAWARPDGIVLLSPAAPSFGRFHDYRHRAQVFAEATAACVG